MVCNFHGQSERLRALSNVVQIPFHRVHQWLSKTGFSAMNPGVLTPGICANPHSGKLKALVSQRADLSDEPAPDAASTLMKNQT